MPALASYRRLAGEMREALERESWKPGGLRYKIDCMAEDGDLHSTWTRLPAPFQYMKSIEIDFRIFNYASGKWGVCGGQGLMVSALLRLLGQFFALWPDTPLQGNLRSALKVDELTINHLWMFEGPRIHWSSNDGSAEKSAFNSLWSCCLYKLERSDMLLGRVGILLLLGKPGTARSLKLEDHRDTIATAKQWSAYGWAPVKANE